MNRIKYIYIKVNLFFFRYDLVVQFVDIVSSQEEVDRFDLGPRLLPSYVVFACSSCANDCEPLPTDRYAARSATALTAGGSGLESRGMNLQCQ